MALLQVATLFASWYFLQFSLTNGKSPGTKFTKTPPNPLYVPLGSTARFKWEFTFGDSKDWGKFFQIIWGKTDNSYSHMRTKYITVVKDGGIFFNSALDYSIRSRAKWNGNISQQQGCQIEFLLKNVSKSDQTTYGCTTDLAGEPVKDGPIKSGRYRTTNHKQWTKSDSRC